MRQRKGEGKWNDALRTVANGQRDRKRQTEREQGEEREREREKAQDTKVYLVVLWSSRRLD